MQMKTNTAKILSRFLTTTVSTFFMAWKLHHRTLKNAASVIKDRETTFLLERCVKYTKES